MSIDGPSGPPFTRDAPNKKTSPADLENRAGKVSVINLFPRTNHMTMHNTAANKRQSPTPLDKIVAVIAAIPLVAAETGLNAEHLAASEGWASTLVLGAVGATLAAAIALPIAERALAKGYRLKAFGLGLF